MTNRADRSGDVRSRIRTLNSLRVVFSLLAVGLIILGLLTLRQTPRSRRWAKVEGKVITSNVNEFTGKGGRTYRPMVIYAYSVGAVRFMSSRIASRPLASSDRSAAARFVEKYPVGKTVQVFYDPQDPEQAVLEPGANPWLPMIAGGVFSMLAVGMRILRARIEKRQGRNA